MLNVCDLIIRYCGQLIQQKLHYFYVCTCVKWLLTVVEENKCQQTEKIKVVRNVFGPETNSVGINTEQETEYVTNTDKR
jgi:hypothetical protein